MTNTVDEREIEQFSSLSNMWWDKSGPFSALHKMSNVRIEFIKNNASRIIRNKNTEFKLLDGLKCLDVGCGGGILSERLSRLGARVTGIDASENSIDVAKEHSINSRLEIDYKCISTSEILKNQKKKYLNRFDIVIASEVIEHINERKVFLSDVSKLCSPGGLVVFTTINSSFMGVLLGKFFAENILKVVPQNTHDPKKFISPQRLSLEAEEHNIILDNFVGFTPRFQIENILKREFGDFRLSSSTSVNYGAAGIRL